MHGGPVLTVSLFSLFSCSAFNFSCLFFFSLLAPDVADKHRGFGFVEFDSEEDAADAIENMDGSELFGRVIRCSVAKAISKLAPGKALWNDEEWIKAHLEEEEQGGEEALREEGSAGSSRPSDKNQ